MSTIEDGRGGGGLLGWDGGDAELVDRDHCMGLALAGDRFARLLSSTADTGTTAELAIYDRGGIRTYHRIDDAPHAHDLCFDESSGRWVVVASGNDQILWLDGSGEVARRWFPPDRPPGRHGDAWHVNCLTYADGRLHATAFGENRDATERLDRISEARGFVFDVESGDRVLDGIVTPHHPVRVGDAWIVCSSWQGTIERHTDGVAEVTSLHLGGWTRGVALVDGHLVVGVSGARHHPTERASLAVVDLETFTEVHRQPLPTREVYAVVSAPAEVLGWVRIGWNNNPARRRQELRSTVLGLPGIGRLGRWAQRPGRSNKAVWRIGRRMARTALPGPAEGPGALDRTPPLRPLPDRSVSGVDDRRSIST